MPVVWRLDGVWLSNVTAELLAFSVTLVLFAVKRKKYRYV